uniref:Uncharacterized protein n=1 Tax=Aegilops tauschii TaxID=37682 RepID=R7W4J6_AEGTA
MPNMTVTRSSAEDLHAAAGEQQQPQQQAADKAPRTTEEEPADFTNLSRQFRVCFFVRISVEQIFECSGSALQFFSS